MKRLAPLVLIVALLAGGVNRLDAASGSSDRSPAAGIATAITTVTGIAISPLLGTGAYGAYQYFRADADQRASLPWYARPSFWLPALGIVLACAFKDTLGAVLPPGFKKPLDILETIENQATGLVAAGAVVPFTMDALSKMLVSSVPASPLVTTGTATLHMAAIDWSWLLNILTVPFGIAVFALVWMGSHAINVLILLSPWGAIDAALKSARTALLGVLTLTATMNPWISAALSLVVLVVAYFIAGWAFRLTIFGTAFSWDFFTLRKRRFRPDETANRLFVGGNLPDVPPRTYGSLQRNEAGLLVFRYRPWLVFKERSVTVAPATLAVGRGLFFSTIIDTETRNTFFILPPRYRDHEEEVVRIYQLNGVQEAGLRKAWGALRELFGGEAAKTQVV